MDDPQNAAKYHSALWYYRQDVEIPEGKVAKYESTLRKWFRAASKEVAQARQEGRLPARKGKLELSYMLFKKLAELFMTWFVSQFHFFHLLMWTCCGRSNKKDHSNLPFTIYGSMIDVENISIYPYQLSYSFPTFSYVSQCSHLHE